MVIYALFVESSKGCWPLFWQAKKQSKLLLPLPIGSCYEGTFYCLLDVKRWEINVFILMKIALFSLLVPNHVSRHKEPSLVVIYAGLWQARYFGAKLNQNKLKPFSC